MTRKAKFIKGEWIVECQVCEKEIYASQAKHRWDGLVVCREDFETRHSMDFIRVPKEDSQSLPFVSPEPSDTFVSVSYANTDNSSVPSGTFDQSL